jgi:hypothetical protein
VFLVHTTVRIAGHASRGYIPGKTREHEMRILVTGQMRSGTTFLTNVLNSQPGMRILPDFLHIERLQRQIGNPSLTEPLTSRQKEAVIQRFLGGGDGWQEIETATGAALPCQVSTSDFASLRDFYLCVLDQVQKGGYTAVGHKTTSAERILRELLESIPDLYCIYMYRDPRDVVVSNGMEMGQAPLTVLENWRESWETVAKVKADSKLSPRLFLLRYEDLICKKSDILPRLTRFLRRTELSLPAEMSWHGKRFIANSSFADVNQLFDKTPIGRWKKHWPWVGLLAHMYLGAHLKQAGYCSSWLIKCRCVFIKKPHSVVARLWHLSTYVDLQHRRIQSFPEVGSISPGPLSAVPLPARESPPPLQPAPADRKSRRAVVVMWAPPHRKELQRLVTYLQRETCWQPVVLLGDPACAPPEARAEWKRLQVPWFVFGSVRSLQRSWLHRLFRLVSATSCLLADLFLLMPLSIASDGLATAKQIVSPLVWTPLRTGYRRVRALVRSHVLGQTYAREGALFIRQALGFPQQFLHLLLTLKRARVTFAHLRPNVLVFAEDNVSFPTGLLIKAAHETDAASVVVPYTLANVREFVEGFRNDPACSTQRFYNYLIGLLYPNWCHRENDQVFLRLPGHHVLAMELLDGAPERPWIPNNGHWDAFAVESRRMHERYAHEFRMPAEKLILTGAMSDDALFRAKATAADLKENVYSELGLVPGRPMLLVALPPNQFSRHHPDLEFHDYRGMILFLVESLRTLTGYNVVFTLHPRTPSDAHSYIEELGAKISTRDSVELVAACDLYVASASATIRWALVCNVPVINYDVYQYRYDDYADTPGVLTIQTKKEWLDLLHAITVEANWHLSRRPYSESKACAWGFTDGSSGRRIVELLDRLATPSSHGDSYPAIPSAAFELADAKRVA